jgi:nucleoside-diphosphate-sugar epimerase
MKALVTGASGMLGRHLVDVLLGAGVRVRAFVRPESDIGHLHCPPCELAFGDAQNREAIWRAVEGVDMVFHLAGYLSVAAPFGLEEAVEPYRTVNVAFTEELLAASAACGVGRFLFCSSNTVYALDVPVPTPEEATRGEATRRPHSVYGRSKLAAEERVGIYQRRGLPTTIIRPTIMYGPGDRYFTPTALRLARLPLLPLVNGGNNFFDLAYVRDVAELFWTAAQSEAAVGRIYNAGPGQPTTLAQLVQAYEALEGGAPRVVSITPRVARRLSFLTRPIMAHVAPGSEAIMAPQGIELMATNMHVDMRRAACELDYRPRFTLQEGLRQTLQAIAC